MASSRQLISSQVLGTSAASVTFSAIPSTFTDLCLKISARTTFASTNGNVFVRFNSDSAANYSYTMLQGTASAAYSYTFPGETNDFAGAVSGANATANTFGSIEMYIPSYTASQKKPLNSISASESNVASNVLIESIANLWQGTATITSITLSTDSTSFAAGSSFYLYGIKNS